MKRIIEIVFLFMTFFSFAQVTEKIYWFETTSHYRYNKISKDYVIPKKIKFKSEKFLRITKLLNPLTKKKSKKISYPWAIYCDSTLYFNLRYGTSIKFDELYIKPDVKGRYCVVYANKEILEIIYQFSTQYYGGGLLGVLINDSSKWGRNWKNEKGEKVKILIVDTKKLEIRNSKGRGNAAWKVLSKKNINEILNTNYNKEVLKEMSLDQVKDIIKEKNNVS